MTTSTVGLGVVGATSWIHTAAIARAVRAVAGLDLVHEASRTWAPTTVELDGDSDPEGDEPRPTATSGEAAVPRRRSQDYNAVLADPEVDLVYVPLPNHRHEELVAACAEAGKHVLCEKPLGIDAASAQRMADACDAAGVHLLEAYMSPFHPRTEALYSALADGMVGEVRYGTARMSGVMAPDNHRWRVDTGGGALLDVGIYCLEPVLTALGWKGEDPDEVAASSLFGGDGVDGETSAWLRFGNRTAHLWVSFAAADQQRLTVSGTDGTIAVPERHATPDRRDRGFDLRAMDGTVTTVPTDTGDCYEGLLAHARGVVLGDAEPLRPASRSVALARVLDAIADAAGHRRP